MIPLRLQRKPQVISLLEAVAMDRRDLSLDAFASSTSRTRMCRMSPLEEKLFGGETLKSVALVPETLQSMDCLVILTDHSVVDYSMVAKFSPAVVDTRNTLNGFSRSCLKVL